MAASLTEEELAIPGWKCWESGPERTRHARSSSGTGVYYFDGVMSVMPKLPNTVSVGIPAAVLTWLTRGALAATDEPTAGEEAHGR